MDENTIKDVDELLELFSELCNGRDTRAVMVSSAYLLCTSMHLMDYDAQTAIKAASDYVESFYTKFNEEYTNGYRTIQ